MIQDIIEYERELLEESKSIKDFEITIYENDSGLMIDTDPFSDPSYDEFIVQNGLGDQGQPQPAQGDQGAPDQEGQPQPAQGDQGAPDQEGQGQPSPEEQEEMLINQSINQTQDLFMKIYLIKRIDKLDSMINRILQILKMKMDTDKLHTIKNYKLILRILSIIALTIPTQGLYQILVDLEFDIKNTFESMIQGIDYE